MTSGADWTNTFGTLTPILALGYLLACLLWISSTMDMSGAMAGFFGILVLIASIGVVGSLLGHGSVPLVAGFFLLALSFLAPALWFVLLPAGFAIAGAGIVRSDDTSPEVSDTHDPSPTDEIPRNSG